MSWVSEIKEICGDYYIDIKYHEDQKEAITLFFNSHRNAETVKRCIELDDIVPNAATAVDFVEVVRCKDCDVPHNKWLGCPNLNGLIPPPDFYCARGTRTPKKERASK